jgi:4'-phosphopantetheinyl transferase EntD
MIECLLPRQVAGADIRGDDPSAELLPEEAAQVAGAARGRQREFATARACARRALRQLGLPTTAILRGPGREPLWPPGAVGSITHCEGYRAAAVARQLDVLTVGIDAEIHQPLPAEVLNLVLAPGEQAWLTEAPQGIHWDRLFFSAKESVYKAWFPLTGAWLGFEDVAVRFVPEAGIFCAQLLLASPAAAGLGLAGFSGHFLVRDGLVLTAIAVLRQQGGRLGRQPL